MCVRRPASTIVDAEHTLLIMAEAFAVMGDTTNPADLRQLAVRARRLADAIDMRDQSYLRLLDYAELLEKRACEIEAAVCQAG